jgi:Ni,Fe-hydrogenase I large subunit
MPEAKQIEDEAVEVELENETEKEVEGTQVSVGGESEEIASEETSDEDLEGYSDKVKKRIEKLTYKMREAERREKAATEYAQSVQKQNEELAKRSSQIDESYISEYDQRVTSQEDGLKKKLSDAINLGDVDAQIEAQKSIAKLAIESERLNVAKYQLEQRKAAPPQPQPQAQPQPTNQPDPKARSWAERNSWFGENEPMTLTAFSIHKSLVENEYFDPSSDEYYQELDKRIREEFPHKFQQDNRSSARAPVAGATRSSGKPSNKKIKLSPSQVAIADKLGVSYEQYAKQLARLQS